MDRVLVGIAHRDAGDIPAAEFPRHFQEEHVQHSNALHGVTGKGASYLVRPVAACERLDSSLRECGKIKDDIVDPKNNSIQTPDGQVSHYFQICCSDSTVDVDEARNA